MAIGDHNNNISVQDQPSRLQIDVKKFVKYTVICTLLGFMGGCYLGSRHAYNNPKNVIVDKKALVELVQDSVPREYHERKLSEQIPYSTIENKIE